MLEYNYELVVAENGEKAISIIEANSRSSELPDLILLDVMLPDANGIELCQRFKKDNQLLHIPIIIVTTLDSDEDKINALAAGANDFLVKPVDKTELFLKVQNHITIADQFKQIKHQNDEINRFVEVIVHDLKNPLSVIMGYIELLELTPPYSESDLGMQYLSQLNRASGQMLNSISEILDYRRIQKSSFNLKLNPFDVVSRIEESIPQWKILAGKKRIEIYTHYHLPGLKSGLISIENQKWIVSGDREKFKDIFDNLISNALKYSPVDTVIDVIVETMAQGFTKITVKDQGLGLSTEDKQKVFGEYQKLSAKPTGSESSTGLGLSIVRRLVELMGGMVGVESYGKGKGSAFWFTLPNAPLVPK
jgi:signal transduction histidine kinase